MDKTPAYSFKTSSPVGPAHTGDGCEMRTCHVNMVYTDHGLIVQQTLPNCIHRLGKVYLRHLGEVLDRAD